MVAMGSGEVSWILLTWLSVQTLFWNPKVNNHKKDDV